MSASGRASGVRSFSEYLHRNIDRLKYRQIRLTWPMNNGLNSFVLAAHAAYDFLFNSENTNCRSFDKTPNNDLRSSIFQMVLLK